MTARHNSRAVFSMLLVGIVIPLLEFQSRHVQGQVLTMGNRSVGVHDLHLHDGLVPHTQTAAVTNRTKLQARIDVGPSIYPWFLRGGNGSLRSYRVDSTVIIKHAGRELLGVGAANPFGGTNLKYGSYLAIRAQSSATTFDGTLITASATSAANSVMTLAGRTVVAQDKWNSFEITGGTNFTAGWYTIIDINTTANTWTLDRDCTNGAGASAMTGYYCPTLIQDHGAGTSVRGIGFLGRTLEADPLAGSIGYHIVTATLAGTGNPGKHHLENCLWDSFHTAVLLGPGMAKYGQTTTYQNWYGAGQLHADESVFTNCRFRRVTNGFAIRNGQAVEFTFNHLKANSLSGSMFRFDSGGKMVANGVHISGSDAGTTQRCLYLGNGVSGSTSGHDPYIINGLFFDGGDTTRNPQLVVNDWDAQDLTARVAFNGVRINRAAVHDSMYLVDVSARCFVTVRDAVGGFWASSVRLRDGSTSTWDPVLVLENCTLGVTTVSDIVDEPNSDAGAKVRWRNCVGSDGVLLADGEYTTI